jgi:hypothetical protein
MRLLLGENERFFSLHSKGFVGKCFALRTYCIDDAARGRAGRTGTDLTRLDPGCPGLPPGLTKGCRDLAPGCTGLTPGHYELTPRPQAGQEVGHGRLHVSAAVPSRYFLVHYK